MRTLIHTGPTYGVHVKQILELKQLENSLAALGQAVDELAQQHHAVVQGLQAQRVEREKLVQAYCALF